MLTFYSRYSGAVALEKAAMMAEAIFAAEVVPDGAEVVILNPYSGAVALAAGGVDGLRYGEHWTLRWLPCPLPGVSTMWDARVPLAAQKAG